MGLRFDGRTGKMTGRLGEIPSEKRNRIDKLVAEGKLLSTRHSHAPISADIVEWQQKQYDAACKRLSEAKVNNE